MGVLIRKVNTMIINLESNTEKKISDIAESLDIIESLARILIECKKMKQNSNVRIANHS